VSSQWSILQLLLLAEAIVVTVWMSSVGVKVLWVLSVMEVDGAVECGS